MVRPVGASSITIKRAPLITDPRDNSFYRDWTAATLTVIKNCLVIPFPLSGRFQFEDEREREFARTSVKVYCPPKTDAIYTDRFLYDGDEYFIVGHPGTWVNFQDKKRYLGFVGQLRKG